MAFTARTETSSREALLTSPYSFTINKATGTVDGDIMFMFLATFLAGTPPTIDSVPAGWTLVATNTTTYSRWYLYYKIASGEGANYTWSLTASCRYYALNIAYSSGDFDVQSIGDITAISNTLYPTAGATVRAASMNVPAANSPLVYFGAIYNTTVRTFTKPSVPTNDWVEDADEGNTTPDLSLTIGSMIWAGSGNTGNMGITCSTSITTYKHAFAVALKPVPPPVVVPTLITIGAPSVTSTTALGFGSIEATGGENCDQRGFDYGFDTDYGSEALDSGDFGVGTYEKLITGLLPDTTYHFRAKAHNSAGWGYGADDTFTTSAAGSTETLRPNAAGDVSNLLDYPTAGDDWDKVDEAVADEATTYIYTSGGGVSLFNLPAHSGSGTINFIKVYARCAWGENGDSCRIAIKTGGTEYYSGPINESADWVTYNYQWNTNPKTSAAWTWDDIDALQIGIELSGQGVENNNCTQVYVEVDYTEVPAEQELTASAVAVDSSVVNGVVSGSGNAPLTGVPVSVSSSVQTSNIAGSGSAPLTASPVAVVTSVPSAAIAGSGTAGLTATPVAVVSSVVNASIEILGQILVASPISITSSVVNSSISGLGTATLTASPIDVTSNVQPASISGSGTVTLSSSPVLVTASAPSASISGSGNAPLTPSPVTVASSVQPASISGSGTAPLVSVSVAVNATVNTAGISGSGSAPLILSPLAVVASIVASAISGSGSAPLVALSLAVESSVVRPAIGYGNQYLTHTAIAIETSVVTPTIALVAFILATAYLHSREAEAYLYDREKTAYLYDRDYVARGRTG